MPDRQFWWDWSNSVSRALGGESQLPIDGSRHAARKGYRGMSFLRERAITRWRKRCPCCGRAFAFRKIGGNKLPSTFRTMGHDEPTSKGGNPHRWIWICHGCNHEQANRTFAHWAHNLKVANDPRYTAVEAVAAFFREHAPTWLDYTSGLIAHPSWGRSAPQSGSLSAPSPTASSLSTRSSG